MIAFILVFFIVCKTASIIIHGNQISRFQLKICIPKYGFETFQKENIEEMIQQPCF